MPSALSSVSLEPLLAAAGASVGLLVGLLTAGLSRAPGLRGLRWLGLIVTSAAVVCVLRSLAGGASDSSVPAMVRVGMGISGLMLYAWLRYEASEVNRPVTPVDHALRGGALGFGFLCLVPSLMVSTHIVRHGDGFSGGTYVDVAPTPLGSAGLFALIGAEIVLQVRYVRRWRAGSRTAGAHALGLADRCGSLEPGKQADLLLLNVSDYRELPYYFGTNNVHQTIKGGRALAGVGL